MENLDSEHLRFLNKGERAALSLRLIAKAWGVNLEDLFKAGKLSRAVYNSWNEGELTHGPQTASLTRLLNSFVEKFPDKNGVKALTADLLRDDPLEVRALVSARGAIFRDVFDDLCINPVVDEGSQEGFAEAYKGFYFMVRRNRIDQSFIRELVYIGERDEVGVECFLYSGRGTAYRGGAYVNRETLQMVFARSDTDRQYSPRLAMLTYEPGKPASAMNGVQLRAVGTGHLPAFSHFLLHAVDIRDLLEFKISTVADEADNAPSEPTAINTDHNADAPHPGALTADLDIDAVVVSLKQGRPFIEDRAAYEASAVRAMLWDRPQKGLRILGDIHPTNLGHSFYQKIFDAEMNAPENSPEFVQNPFHRTHTVFHPNDMVVACQHVDQKASTGLKEL